MSSIYVLFDSLMVVNVFEYVNTKTDYRPGDDIFLFYDKYVPSNTEPPDKIFCNSTGKYVLPLHNKKDASLLFMKMDQANRKIICVLDGAMPIDVVNFLRIMDDHRHEIIYIHFTNNNVNIS